jgi:hypothetical protein
VISLQLIHGRFREESGTTTPAPTRGRSSTLIAINLRHEQTLI